MGLRTDLVQKVTPDMLLKGVLANQHRYRPEPRLATTGVGNLAPTTPEDINRDSEIRKALNRKVLKAAARR